MLMSVPDDSPSGTTAANDYVPPPPSLFSYHLQHRQASFPQPRRCVTKKGEVVGYYNNNNNDDDNNNYY